MKWFIYLIVHALTVFSYTNAQQLYNAGSVPKDLLPRASAVVRDMKVNVDVRDLNDVIYTEKKAITVFNKNGDDDAAIQIWYDKSRQLKSVKGTVYNEFGIAVAKISEKNFSDVSAANDFSLYEDSRVKIFKPAVNAYPYTIEYEYEVQAKQTLYFDDWYPNRSTGISVENASYTFTCKPNFKIRIKENNYPGKAEGGINGKGLTVYFWQIQNIKALRDEPYSPDADRFLTRVSIAPEKFAYRGLSGSFTNWTEYGKWVSEDLLKGRSEIPAGTAAQIKELTKDLTDPKDKARKIYEYMQKKMRYISVQIGIGGFQPISASEVDRMSYGDCKGLVNYTRGLLDLAGIKSYYTVVEAGSLKKDADPNFASMNQGNHVILCLPFASDTTWLECTSQQIPFGFLGDFTDDRLVVACTEDGGKIMRTPRYEALANKQIRQAKFRISEDGEASAEMITQFTGAQYENREPIILASQTEQRKKLAEIYPINNIQFEAVSLKQDKSSSPSTVETISFKARDYGAINGNHLEIPLNLVNRYNNIPREVSNRTMPLYINRGFSDIDELNFTLPDGYKIDSYPKNLSIEKPFGKFSVTLEVKGNSLAYTRKIELKDGTYPPENYQEFVNFYQAVSDADNRKISMVRK